MAAIRRPNERSGKQENATERDRQTVRRAEGRLYRHNISWINDWQRCGMHSRPLSRISLHGLIRPAASAATRKSCSGGSSLGRFTSTITLYHFRHGRSQDFHSGADTSPFPFPPPLPFPPILSSLSFSSPFLSSPSVFLLPFLLPFPLPSPMI